MEIFVSFLFFSLSECLKSVCYFRSVFVDRFKFFIHVFIHV